jgi:hypothetical protein
MRSTAILAFLAGLVVAYGCDGGNGDHQLTSGARDPGRAETRSDGSAPPAAEPVPFGPRSAKRQAQDSVLRTVGSRRRKMHPDSTQLPDPSMAR